MNVLTTKPVSTENVRTLASTTVAESMQNVGPAIIEQIATVQSCTEEILEYNVTDLSVPETMNAHSI